MRNGDILKCIDNIGRDLTLNKKYIILNKIMDDPYVSVIDDNGIKVWFYRRRFINLTEQRIKKLQKILT